MVICCVLNGDARTIEKVAVGSLALHHRLQGRCRKALPPLTAEIAGGLRGRQLAANSLRQLYFHSLGRNQFVQRGQGL
jgi:hypothetical protein